MKTNIFIDKIEFIERGIEKFPFLYIEGAAACGKSTALNMFLAAHPDTPADVFYMNKETEIETFTQRLDQIANSTLDRTEGRRFLVFENFDQACGPQFVDAICELVQRLSEELGAASGSSRDLDAGDLKVIFVSREKPPVQLLELLWKSLMAVVPAVHLSFSLNDVAKLRKAYNSHMVPEELYDLTGGWPGCVTAMLGLESSAGLGLGGKTSAAEIFASYEIQTYIKKVILGSLTLEEKKVVAVAAQCPWVNEELLSGALEVRKRLEVLADLQRKGILKYNKGKGYWRINPLFGGAGAGAVAEAGAGARVTANAEAKAEGVYAFDQQDWIELAKWYEKGGFVEEALKCWQQAQRSFESEPPLSDQCSSESEPGARWILSHYNYRRCMIENFGKVPFEILVDEPVDQWEADGIGGGSSEKDVAGGYSIDDPRGCYLRGMHAYLNQDFAGLSSEMKKVQAMIGTAAGQSLAAEVYLNLAYVSPAVTMDQWIELLECYGPQCAPVRLHHLTNNSVSFLSGLRELSDLYICSSREEKRRKRLFEDLLGTQEFTCFELAKVEFDFKIRKKDLTETEEWRAVVDIAARKRPLSWQGKIACLYLVSKVAVDKEEPEMVEIIGHLKDQLQWEDTPLCQHYLNAVHRLYDLWGPDRDKTTRWLKMTIPDMTLEVNELNFFMLYVKAKGYLMLNQFDYAGRILEAMIPYAQQFGRGMVLAELHFQLALVNWSKGQKGLSLKNMVQSFLYTGQKHFVDFYVSYGALGHQVLADYIKWLQTEETVKWQRKKKYNYGNVLKMPQEDYLESLLRMAKRNAKASGSAGVGGEAGDGAGRNDHYLEVEKLTMTEIIVLQNIGKGLSNADICRELNLKLPTVKTHISNIYKKLGVGSRVQAIVKGKEIGVLK